MDNIQKTNNKKEAHDVLSMIEDANQPDLPETKADKVHGSPLYVESDEPCMCLKFSDESAGLKKTGDNNDADANQ